MLTLEDTLLFEIYVPRSRPKHEIITSIIILGVSFPYLRSWVSPKYYHLGPASLTAFLHTETHARV